jgi:hypothetical protein
MTSDGGAPHGERIESGHTVARIAELDDRVEAIAAALDGMEATLQQVLHTGPPTPPAAPGDTATAPARGDNDDTVGGLDMRTLVGWVRENIALLLERKMPQSGGAPYWCQHWWLHPEAIARFEALRRAWLEATTQPGAGLVVYFEHLDLQLSTLCGENGPFCGCVGGHNPTSPARRLGHIEPDEAYYRDVDTVTARDTPMPPIPAPAHRHRPGGPEVAPPGPVPGTGRPRSTTVTQHHHCRGGEVEDSEPMPDHHHLPAGGRRAMEPPDAPPGTAGKPSATPAARRRGRFRGRDGRPAGHVAGAPGVADPDDRGFRGALPRRPLPHSRPAQRCPVCIRGACRRRNRPGVGLARGLRARPSGTAAAGGLLGHGADAAPTTARGHRRRTLPSCVRGIRPG